MGSWTMFRSRLFWLLANGVLGSTLVPVKLRWRALNVLGCSLDPVQIGPRVWIGGPQVTMGEGTGVNIGCVFDTLAPITIGRRVSIGHEAMLLTSTHEHGTEGKAAGRLVGKPIVVGDGAWIGARATVMPGVTIGEGCTIAACSVVVRDCKPGGTYAGIPARLVRTAEPAEAAVPLQRSAEPAEPAVERTS